MSEKLIAEIAQLKKDKDVAILAHYYEEGAIQDIADYVGDSFYLAKMGQQVPNKNILLARQNNLLLEKIHEYSIQCHNLSQENIEFKNEKFYKSKQYLFYAKV